MHSVVVPQAFFLAVTPGLARFPKKNLWGAGCHSCRSTYSVKALKGTYSTDVNYGRSLTRLNSFLIHRQTAGEGMSHHSKLNEKYLLTSKMFSVPCMAKTLQSGITFQQNITDIVHCICIANSLLTTDKAIYSQ